VPPSLDSSPALWPFAVHVYALPGVSELCLRLQDEHRLDVGVLLAILWRSCRGVAVDAAALDRMRAAAAPLQARVRELRALRVAVGSDRAHEPRWQETYEHLKAAELAAERVELSVLEATLAAARPEPAAGSTTAQTSPAVPATIALSALRGLAELCGAPSCDPLLQALVEAVVPRPGGARD
jgi:uncharacterized protein (TIGR02444 family)